MNKIKFVMAAALLAATAACTQTGYDNSYAYNNGGSNSGYNTNSNNNGYWRNGVYYTNSNSSGYNNSGYNNASANPFYSPSAGAAQRQPYGDQDRDGVRNRNDSDANGDGIPDFVQR
ncbi:MAG: hypothetical protein EXR12_05470 [Rhodospirillaceae bacterium]|nr:hypothetical protein [Rhodospirillaceae bacterium]